jgi:hypothetical protein
VSVTSVRVTECDSEVVRKMSDWICETVTGVKAISHSHQRTNVSR